MYWYIFDPSGICIARYSEAALKEQHPDDWEEFLDAMVKPGGMKGSMNDRYDQIDLYADDGSIYYTPTALIEFDPEEIDGDGSSVSALTIRKVRKCDGEPMTLSDDNDSFDISTSRGTLSASTGRFVNGVCEGITIQSSKETVKAWIDINIIHDHAFPGTDYIKFV